MHKEPLHNPEPPPWQEASPERLVLRGGDLFTHRQAEILQLILDGYNEKQIAASLRIAPSTLKNHLYGTDTAAGGKRAGANRTEMGIYGVVEKYCADLPNPIGRPTSTIGLITVLTQTGLVTQQCLPPGG